MQKLLPLLLSYTGGVLVYDKRGGVAGAIGTIGLIVGTGIAMFLGAMILGNDAGTLVYSLLNVGLFDGPSPGSVFAYLMLTPKGNFAGSSKRIRSA